jgi:hypothetical protein
MAVFWVVAQNPEDSHLCTHSREKQKSYSLKFVLFAYHVPIF